MISRHRYGSLTWLDLESPTHAEVQAILNEFNIDTLVAEELLLPSTKPRVEFHTGHTYVILHFPALRHTHHTLEQEVDFVIGDKYLITTHYEMIDPLHKFEQVFEMSSILEKNDVQEHGVFLFFLILKKLYRAVEHESEFVRRDILMVEENIFSGHEVDMVKAISRSARDLLNLRQTIEPHREVLKTLETDGVAALGERFAPYLRALANEYYRMHNHIMRHTDSLHELRETNDSLLSSKENETMRVLTIMALLTFPLALMVAILQIDTIHNPIRGLPYDFWIILGAVVVTGTCMILYFRHKKWL